MGTTFKWSEQDKQKLVECTTPEEMLANFPNKKLANLMRRQTEFKSERNGNGNGNRKENHDFDPDFVVPLLPETTERTVPLAVYNRALRQLDDSKRRKADYIETLTQAVQDAMTSYQIGIVPPPVLDKSTKVAEVCVPLVSDLQLAKKTIDYNTSVAEERMYAYAKKIVNLAEVQRSDHPVPKCHVMCLGDQIEGIDVFPGQAWLVDAGLYRQICVDGPRIFTGFFRYLLEHFEIVEVDWVIGNHGRIGRKGVFDPEANGDRMLGQFVKTAMSNEPRFIMRVPDGHGDRNWYTIAQEGSWKAFLFHGDQIRGHSGVPWYGFAKSISGWASGGLPYPDNEFKTALCGHFHQACRIPINTKEVYINGSLESQNQYASEQLKSMADPQQWTLFVSPEKGRVTASYLVDLI